MYVCIFGDYIIRYEMIQTNESKKRGITITANGIVS